MSCDKCDCIDCRSDRAIAQAKNLANEVDDDDSMPAWCFAGKANDVQAKAWGEAADYFLDRYAPNRIYMRTLVSVIMYRVNVRHENQARLSPQVERFLHENYSVAKGGLVSLRRAFLRAFLVFLRSETETRRLLGPGIVFILPSFVACREWEAKNSLEV